jgi:hypothetical protein
MFDGLGSRVRRPMVNELLRVTRGETGGVVLRPNAHSSLLTAVCLQQGDLVALNNVPSELAKKYNLSASMRGTVEGDGGKIRFLGLPTSPEVRLNELLGHDLVVTIKVFHVS